MPDLPSIFTAVTGQLGDLAFVALFFFALVAELAFIPRTPVLLASGLVFGVVAAPIALTGATLGAAIAFLVARHAGRKRVSAFVAARPRAQAILRAVDGESWRLLALLRFWGPVPASIQNVAFALTTISLRVFILVSLAAGLPQAVAYAYIGGVGGEMLRNGGFGSVQTIVGLALACLCIAAAGWIVGRRARDEFAAAKAGSDSAALEKDGEAGKANT